MKDYKHLLDTFWAGKATGTEKLQLYKLIVEQEEQLRRDEVLPNLAAGSGSEPLLAPEESREMLELLHREINLETPRIPPAERALRRLPWLRIAAVAAVLCGVALLFKWMFPGITTTPRMPIAAKTVTERTISNTLASIQTMRLGDSSIVSLYPGSSITLPDTFATGSRRIVRLKGKAGFKVKHDTRRPFEVIAMRLKTTDIGTDFTVDALQADVVRVKLKEGCVRVESLPGSRVVLDRKIQTAGEELNVNLVTAQITTALPMSPAGRTSPVEVGRRVAPARMRLVFNRTPLAEVFTRLAEREQVKIQFNQHDIDGLTFTGSIEPREQLEGTLNILCGLNGLSYHKNGKDIEVTPNK